MSKIKVAELFYSLQGEGQYIGTPSIFLRVFGCNFQCQGFSMPRGELSQERMNIDPTKYERYEDLPLVHTLAGIHVLSIYLQCCLLVK